VSKSIAHADSQGDTSSRLRAQNARGVRLSPRVRALRLGIVCAGWGDPALHCCA